MLVVSSLPKKTVTTTNVSAKSAQRKKEFEQFMLPFDKSMGDFYNNLEAYVKKMQENDDYDADKSIIVKMFNDYIKGLKNREKITINLNEIADKINVRVDNLKNKPEPNAILGATVLVQFCAHKYNYDVLEFGFNFCVIKKRFLSSFDRFHN